MASSHDKNGRPIVVVTGMGVITSLGAGKADNWAKLTAGESGIHRITRFANDGLKTTIAGSVDFIPVEPFCSTDLGERMAAMVAEEAITEAGHRRARATSPARCSWRSHRWRSSGRIATCWRPRPAPTTRSDTTTCCARAPRAASTPSMSAVCSAPSPSILPTSSAPRARPFRCPPPVPRARARSSSASRRSVAAKPRPHSASAPTARLIRRH